MSNKEKNMYRILLFQIFLNVKLLEWKTPSLSHSNHNSSIASAASDFPSQSSSFSDIWDLSWSNHSRRDCNLIDSSHFQFYCSDSMGWKSDKKMLLLDIKRMLDFHVVTVKKQLKYWFISQKFIICFVLTFMTT